MKDQWGVSKYVFNIRDKSTIEVSQKLYDSELTEVAINIHGVTLQ